MTHRFKLADGSLARPSIQQIAREEDLREWQRMQTEWQRDDRRRKWQIMRGTLLTAAILIAGGTLIGVGAVVWIGNGGAL